MSGFRRDAEYLGRVREAWTVDVDVGAVDVDVDRCTSVPYHQQIPRMLADEGGGGGLQGLQRATER